MKYTLYFDGGASPNPGLASCAFKVEDNNGDIILEGAWAMGGLHSNNEAEWEAATIGLDLFIDKYADHAGSITIIGDSELVIRQMSGEYRVNKGHLKKYHRVVSKLIKDNPSISFMFRHIKRDFNNDMDIACKEVRNSKPRYVGIYN